MNYSAFHYSEKARKYAEEIRSIKFAAPSENFVDLELAESGHVYTVESDGYIAIAKGTTASGQSIKITHLIGNGDILYAEDKESQTAGYVIRMITKVRKNEQYSIDYTADGAIEYFRFIAPVERENAQI